MAEYSGDQLESKTRKARSCHDMTLLLASLVPSFSAISSSFRHFVILSPKP